MKRPVKILIITLALLAPVTALAGTYQWKDDAGQAHFTDNPKNIPARYQNRASELLSVDVQGKGTLSTLPQNSLSPGQTKPAGLQSPPEGTDRSTRQAEFERLNQELTALRKGVAEKKKELARIRRKWQINKGRIPTQDELKEFEKKRAKGAVSIKDNPFINRNPLSSPSRYREAYYKKLDEIKQDEERIDGITTEINALNMQ